MKISRPRVRLDPKYVLPSELTLAISVVVENGLKLSEVLKHCNRNVEEIEQSCVQILTESITLTLAAGELLKMHYVFPAEVLVRTIVDRVSTVQHIAINGQQGLRDWQLDKLPSLANRMKALHDFTEDKMRDVVRPHINMLHK